jgi:hypothetical protein
MENIMKHFAAIVLLFTLGACATTQSSSGPKPDDRAQLAALELVSSNQRIELKENALEKLGIPDTSPWYHKLPSAGLSGIPILGAFTSDGSVTLTSKYALPANYAGSTIDNIESANRIVLDMIRSAGLAAGGKVIDQGSNFLLFETLDDASQKPIFLRVWNKGSIAVTETNPIDDYAWGFPVKWKSDNYTKGLNICWGDKLIRRKNGTVKVSDESIPLLDCELGTSPFHTKFLRELTKEPYFLYADKTMSVNRFYFQGKEYSPFF